jgi:Sulfotransferase family
MAYELNYSALDRLFHQLAFAAPFIQLTAADMEKAAYGATFRQARAARPIFVTSLPRAGTTVLLESLAEFPSIATHVYRDMPFVLAPILWSKLSGPFRTPTVPRERAHGDGVVVGFDSPEAFEEIIWRTFWPGKYSPTRIALWSAADRRADARAFFLDHMKKIVALRRPDRVADARYLSKNNANIARLDLIPRMFPDASMVVPVRRPLEHAWSLLRQHENFTAIHRESPFVRRYMADIGHYEFGALHRPLAFPGIDDLLAGRDPLTLDYWLAYWIAAFEYLAAHRGQAIVVGYEAMCADAPRALGSLCGALDVPEEATLARAAARFRPAPLARADLADRSDPGLKSRADEAYRALGLT